MSVIKEHRVKVSNRNMKVMVETYNSAMEVVADCRNRSITNSRFDDMRHRRVGSWEGVDSYDQALEFLHNGYQPTVEKLKESLKARFAGEGKRLTFNNNIVGYAPVVPLAMKGVPNCMIDMQMKPIKAKVIDVYYDITCNANTECEDIIKNGQKLLAVILELEKQGYKFNLYAVQTYSDSESVDVMAIKIKSSTQPIDLKRISFPLTHTAFFRVIGFDWYSKCPKAKYRSGYGRAIGYEFSDSECKDFANKVWGNNALFISGNKMLNKNEEYIKEVILNGSNNKR